MAPDVFPSDISDRMRDRVNPSMTVNVCILTETYYPVTGGGETQARVLAAGFASSGSSVHVLTRRTDRELPKSESLDGATVWRLPPAGRGHLKKWGLVLSAFIRLVRLRHSYDVIIVGGYRVMGIPAVIVAKILRKPCILKADSIGEFSGEFFDPGLRRFGLSHKSFPIAVFLTARNWLLRKSSAFVAISTVIADELRENNVIDAQILRIPNSVDTTRFRSVSHPEEKLALRNALKIPQHMKVGIFTGRLDATKGLPMLLRTWADICREFDDTLLVLVGSGGIGIENCEDQLRRFVSDKNLGSRVVFAGSVNNVDEYLKAADFFVFPTEREAFGISIIEALACKLPVIATATGGICDIVSDSKNAVVVPVNDQGALLTAIKKVLHGGDAIRVLAENGRRLVVERYNERRILQQYQSLIDDLIGVNPHE